MPDSHTNSTTTSAQLLAKLGRNAVGLDTTYTLANGKETRRIYLDSTASTLRLRVVQDILDKYLPHYANTHSILYFGAKLSTSEYHHAHEVVLDFVNADPETYTAIFLGSGTTAGICRVANTLRQKLPDRDVVITSIMEHHSNDLPHRKAFPEIVHIPATLTANTIGSINLERLEESLIENEGRVNYVAVTGVSNVTGIVNPLRDVAELAHRHGALIVVDAAQMAAHLPIQVSGHDDPAHDIDVLIFSGHKVYAPGSPGVIVTRKDLFADQEPQEIGGGVVDDVYINRYMVKKEFPDREEAGTPNIVGAIGLGAALHALKRVGMDVIAREEDELIRYALDKMSTIKDISIYGETDRDCCSRAGAISFNIRGVEHGMTAAVLNDYFNIAVRNECFCAHPYVREMIVEELVEMDDSLSDDELQNLADLQLGMVRASFGIYSTREDIDHLVAGLEDISAKRDEYLPLYERHETGDYFHKTFEFEHDRLFSIERDVDAWLES